MKNGQKTNVQQTQTTSEENLLKALDELEETSRLSKGEGNENEDGEGDEGQGNEGDEGEEGEQEPEKPVKKSQKIPDQMRSTKAANGGLSKTKSDDSENFETGASENEPRTVKSLIDENEELNEGFNASEFLKSFADTIAEGSDLQMAELRKSFDEQRAFNGKLQKAMVAMGNLVVELKGQIEQLGNQPQGPRKTVLSKSEVQEREFQKGGNGDAPQFDRQQVLGALIDMVQKGEAQPVVVSAYETTDYLPPELIPAVNRRLLGRG